MSKSAEEILLESGIYNRLVNYKPVNLNDVVKAMQSYASQPEGREEMVEGEEMTLEDLPPGSLFSYGETICLKSEYREDNGAIDAYIVGTGEMFWGGTNKGEDQNKLIVKELHLPKPLSEEAVGGMTSKYFIIKKSDTQPLSQPSGTGEGFDFKLFRELSVQRAVEGFKTYKNVSLSFWGNAIAGEVGELCNMIKKIDRVAQGGIDAGSSYTAADITPEMIKEEIGGIVIYCDLLASLFDVSLEEAIIETFNGKSKKYGMKQIYPFLSLPPSKEQPAEWKHPMTLREIMESEESLPGEGVEQAAEIPFEFMQFPGPKGSSIHNDTDEEYLKQIIKGQPESYAIDNLKTIYLLSNNNRSKCTNCDNVASISSKTLKKLIAGASWDAGKKDAVEFANWIAEDYTHVLHFGKDRRWCTYDVAEFGSANELDYMTTSQLYTLFTNSKTP